MNQRARGPVKSWAIALLVAVALALGLAACGGDSDEPPPRHATPETPTAAPTTPAAVTTPEPPGPTEFRVAFINLHSPLLQDLGDDSIASTFDERLDLIIAELRTFDPDVVGFNEWFWTPDFSDVATRLGRELQMEPCTGRANPWYPGQTKEESDKLRDDVGFEEGELFLIKATLYSPIKPCEIHELTPRTSESGERRIGLHLLLDGPAGFGGEVDIFITHLKGGSDAIRAEQARDFVRWVRDERGSGPSLVLVGQDDPASASNYDVYRAIGLRDVAPSEEILTCCRTSVVGEQTPMTARNDYLMYDRMQLINSQLLGEEPGELADGALVYASDHLGLAATFRVPEEIEPLP